MQKSVELTAAKFSKRSRKFAEIRLTNSCKIYQECSRENADVRPQWTDEQTAETAAKFRQTAAENSQQWTCSSSRENAAAAVINPKLRQLQRQINYKSSNKSTKSAEKQQSSNPEQESARSKLKSRKSDETAKFAEPANRRNSEKIDINCSKSETLQTASKTKINSNNTQLAPAAKNSNNSLQESSEKSDQKSAEIPTKKRRNSD